MAGEEFSFPVIPNPVSSFTSSYSTSLWRISSKIYHHDGAEVEEEEEDDDDMEIRSANDTVSQRCAREEEVEKMEMRSDGWLDLEERMDMLWEDFNAKEIRGKPLFANHKSTEKSWRLTDNQGKTEQLCALEKSRRSGMVYRTVVMVRMLKKLLLIRKSTHHKRKIF